MKGAIILLKIINRIYRQFSSSSKWWQKISLYYYKVRKKKKVDKKTWLEGSNVNCIQPRSVWSLHSYHVYFINDNLLTSDLRDATWIMISALQSWQCHPKSIICSLYLSHFSLPCSILVVDMCTYIMLLRIQCITNVLTYSFVIRKCTVL